MVDSRKRIAVAFLLGGTIVACAFVVRTNNEIRAQQGALAVVPIAERSHITVVDSDGNGIPNWQESLISAEPIRIDAQASSTYEKPETVTGKLALNFFEEYVRSKAYGTFGASREELVAELTERLEQETADVLFTANDITVLEEEMATATLRAYGNHIASTLASQSTGVSNEVVILQDALRYDKPERLKNLAPITASYTSLVKSMLETPVPIAYTKQHLDLLNALNAVKEDVRGMQMVYEDPIYTFVRLKRYEDDVLGMSYAIGNIFNALQQEEGIQWEADEPAAKLLNLVHTL